MGLCQRGIKPRIEQPRSTPAGTRKTSAGQRQRNHFYMDKQLGEISHEIKQISNDRAGNSRDLKNWFWIWAQAKKYGLKKRKAQTASAYYWKTTATTKKRYYAATICASK